MQDNVLNPLTLLVCLALSTGGYCSQDSSTSSAIYDTMICCLHWIFCPYCFDSSRQVNKFQLAIENNCTDQIEHIIRRRGLSPNQPLQQGNLPILPIIWAAKKAHVESVKQLLKLGADVNSQMQGTGLSSYPSTLIAVCASENLSPERVFETVKVLLEYGADPSRNCIMLTEHEKEIFQKMREEFQKDPTKEKQILSQIPHDWFRQRTALDFAIKHKYVAAIQVIRQAIAEQRKKGIKTDEQIHDQQPEDI